ncbi:hypothetical protein ABW21_db0206279 [Orbilia brochopaga]|nr:hypothetical protein ABW21_db0206279 [Drechslerella brochopaga]
MSLRTVVLASDIPSPGSSTTASSEMEFTPFIRPLDDDRNLTTRLAKAVKGQKMRVMTGRMSTNPSKASKIKENVEHNRQYDRITKYIGDVRDRWNGSEIREIAFGIEEEFFRMIYGSNFIEYAGTGYNETVQICHKIFRGREIDDESLIEPSIEDRAMLSSVSKGDRTENLRSLGASPFIAIYRARLEVIQHARAWSFFLEKFMAKDGEPLSEDLILETHRILCTGYDHDDGTPWQDWAGKYRDYEIAASSGGGQGQGQRRRVTMFIRAAAVPEYMSAMVRDFNAWVMRDDDEIDPFELAAWLSIQFVNIHPFGDGNGRLSRILLNAVLYKFTGLVASLGDEGEASREAYLAIAQRSSKIYHQEDFEVAAIDQTSHVELAALALKRATFCARRLLEDEEAD